MTGRRRNDNDSHRYYDWLDKAQSDMNAARILKMYNGSNDMIAFHCQQAIEKALKGYLLFKSGRHFDGHSLIFLCRQAVKFDALFEDFLDESEILNDYYIETRYPTDIPLDITFKQVEALYSMADSMFSVITKEMNFP